VLVAGKAAVETINREILFRASYRTTETKTYSELINNTTTTTTITIIQSEIS
jgi:hypothetical protein